MTQPRKLYGFLVLLLAVTFYLYEYLIQVSPAVMTTELMQDFSLNAASFSTMVAFFYYAYTPMQLPGGMLYDRFGPRKMITIFMGISVLGAFMFAHAHSYAMAAMGRFLMGLGGAFSFVGPLLIASRWFHAKYFALIAGCVQLVGALGAILGQVLLSTVVEKIGWRDAILYTGIIGAVLVIFICLIVRDYPKGIKPLPQKKFGKGELGNLKHIFRNSQTFIIALFSFCTWVPITVFAALWGVEFLEKMYNLDTTQGASMMAVMWVGVAVGSPLIGMCSERMGKRCFPLGLFASIGFVAAVALIYFKLPLVVSLFLLFFLGVGTSGQSLSFALIRDINHSKRVATAMGVNNLAVVAGGALGQPLVGWLINIGWHGRMLHGLRYYSILDFQRALFIVPLAYLIAALLAKFYIRETNCLPISTNT